ncbi:YeiH family protein [Streptococcus parasanguinis]|uniref:YeiH family protein n=1 Tax=Streptococcus parasanguinis TaxID=1318 RepID=UPI0034A33559
MKTKSLGVAIAAGFALCAMFLGNMFPIIGSSVFALILGIALNEFLDLPENSRPGLNWSGKKLLQYSIIFMGFSLPIATVASTGVSSLKISLPTITVAFLAAVIFGKVFHLKSHLRTLIGFGTAICGGSAIAAAAPIIEADEEEIALSMSTIFFFNILAVFIFPLLGHLWHMSNFHFGLWSGTAINDTSSVVAAGFSYSKAAGEMATIVKLSRALMIVPVCLGLIGLKLYRTKQQGIQKGMLKKIVPWFIVWFIVASILSSIGVVPKVVIPYLKEISQLFMAMALVGIGSKVSWKQFRSAGATPLLVGLIAWFCVAGSSLILQMLLY